MVVPVVVVLVALFVLVVGLIIVKSLRAEERKKGDALGIAGKQLGVQRVGGNVVEGTRGGLPMRFMLTTRGAGSSAESWTELECKLPAVTAEHVQLYLWPSGRDLAEQVAQGRMLDIVVGDALFDGAFVVEGAPTDIVRTALDAPTRAALKALRRCEIQFPRRPHGEPAASEPPASFAVLQLAMRGWLEDEAGIIAALDALTRLAQRLRAAPSEVIEAIPLEGGGTPYRPAPSDDVRTATRERQAHEVRALAALRKRRAGDGSTNALLGIGVVFLVGFILIAALASIPR